MIEAENLVRSYNGTRGLAGFQLRVEPGELFGLVGPNGAGKTTLIKILSTLLRPGGGRAVIGGHDVVREPRAVLAEFGLALPEQTQIRVHDSTADMRYLVLPMRPAGTEGWSEERLAALVNRDSMIGVALPKAP